MSSRELALNIEQRYPEPADQSESAALSLDFFTDKSSYSPFSLTSDHNRIIGCIDPRDPIDVAPGEHKVVIQTAGGAAGEGVDASIYDSIINDFKPSDIEAAIERDKNVRGITVLGAHHDCKFIGGMPSVLNEMHNPSNFTIDSAAKWANYFNQPKTFGRHIRRVMEAAGVQLDYIQEKDRLHDLVEHIDSLRPDHSNVKRLIGENTAKVYVVNLHPHVGLDRNAKPANPVTASAIQGYHDSLAASLGDIIESHNIERRERQVRVTSMILRAAATRTVLTRGNSDTTFIEVTPSKTGLEFSEDK